MRDIVTTEVSFGAPSWRRAMYIVQHVCRQKQAMVPFTKKQPPQKRAAQETGVNVTSQRVTDAKYTPYTVCCQSFSSFVNHPQPSAYCVFQLIAYFS